MICLFYFILMASSQSLTTEKINFHNWEQGTQLLCQNEHDQLLLPVRNFKDKVHKTAVKLGQINGQFFRLESKARTLNIKTMEGEALALTTPDRTEVQIGGRTFFKQRKAFRNRLEYVDKQGLVVVTGDFFKGRITITSEHATEPGMELLMLICFEEMIRRVEEIKHPASMTFYWPG